MLSQNQVVKVKKALGIVYTDLMDVYEYQQTTDPTSHVTSASEVLVLSQVPCRLSSSQAPQTNGSEIASVSQTVKVFFDPQFTVKAGSKIVVKRRGVSTAYMHSGIESGTGFGTHREVVLTLFERWA